MTKAEKLLSRFLSRPKDFTYSELLRLLNSLAYKEQQGSGSRVEKSYKGNLNIRLSPELHKKVAYNATIRGRSLKLLRYPADHLKGLVPFVAVLVLLIGFHQGKVACF